MSISQEITDLQTNLQAAKSAVTTKGGTVADTGLAGLATEIASIPSGGTLDNYGTVTYLDSNDTEQTLTLATVEDFYELCSNTGASSLIHIGNTSFAKSQLKGVTIAEGVTYIPDYFCAGCQSLTNLSLPSTVTSIGSYFGYGSTIPNALNLTNVKYIGPYFLTSIGALYQETISLPNVEYISSFFLSQAQLFNGNIALNDNCKFIGDHFMYRCGSFNKPLTIPSGLEDIGDTSNPGGDFMSRCDNFVGPLTCNGPVPSSMIPTDNSCLSTNNASAVMYTTGITLTGPYAQNWKDALPDRTSSPYRKLIVGS